MALEQSDPRARALEKESDRLYALYQEKADVVAGLWKKASKIVFIPNTGQAQRVIDENNSHYPEFAVASLEKDEAYAAWQKAAYAHGAVLHDLQA